MTGEIAELQESARRVLDGAGLAADEAKTWPQIVELGWLLVAVPEELGGLGLGLTAASALYTEIGRGLAAIPYLPAMLSIDAVCHSGLADREIWVERLAGGENYVATPLAAALLSAEKGGVTGTLSAVPSADKASHVLLMAADQVALLPLAQSGVKVTARQTWDKTRRLFDIRLEAVAIDEELVLARGEAAAALVRRLSTHRDFALAADAVGGASALLERTVEYLQTRRQFARPLALFQAIKHRCADLKTIIAAAEALLVDSLGRIEDPGDEAAALMAKQAKSLACSTYFHVTEEGIQLHGGIGVTAEHPCHLFLKRAMLDAQLGAPGDSYARDIAAAILG